MLKGRAVEVAAFSLSVVVNLVIVGYMTGKLEQRVAILEQLRTESRVEVANQLSEINRKIDRILERQQK